MVACKNFFTMQNKDNKVTHSKSRPNQNVRDTSIEQYPHVKASSKTVKQKKDILEYLSKNGASSRRMIARALNIESGSMCRNIYDLCKAKEVQELPQKRKCKLSGITVYFLELVQND